MTERLYYENAFLYNFSAAALALCELAGGRCALVLDRTAFYPTGGGQPCDTGWLEPVAPEGAPAASAAPLPMLRVREVVEDAGGEILHLVDPVSREQRGWLSAAFSASGCAPLPVRGFVDVERRQDHMQQHSGQHVLSAAFRKLCAAPTLGFELGEEISAIELGVSELSAEQMEQAERLANQVVWEDRQVLMHEVSAEQAQKLGLPAIQAVAGSAARLVEIRGVDLALCGGTHVNSTGQIGNIQLRHWARSERGTRVEFVCGARALRMARADFAARSAALRQFPGQSPEPSSPQGSAQPGGEAPSAGKPPR